MDTRSSFAVTGMTCASCVAHVERALKKVEGVASATVNLATERAVVIHHAEEIALQRAIERVGYGAKLVQQVDAADPGALLVARRELFLALAFALPLLLLTMLPMAVPSVHRVAPSFFHFFMEWGGFALALPVQVWSGRTFHRRAIAEIGRRSLGMSTLVTLGSTAAFAYSLAVLVAPQLFPHGTAHTYFEAAASIITLVLLGKYFESAAKRRSAQSIRSLLELVPPKARVRRGERDVEIAIDALVVGDLLIVRPGERLAADGVIVEGASFVDESMITGEPIPSAKETGASVVAGTVNGAGSFSYRATRVGRDGTLERIVRFVEEAQGSKPEVQVLADRIAAVFVPSVIAAALATSALWLLFGGSLERAIVSAVAVLVVACPCAMGLATPTAVMVGSAKAAELGILFREGTAIESIARITTVLLDKTGTVTEGRPAMTSFTPLALDRPRLLRWIAALEARSEHPIARAIVAAGPTSLPAVTNVVADAGFGISGTVEGHRVEIGSPRYLEKLGVVLEPDRLDAQVVAAIDGVLAAIIGVSDPIKKSSRAAIAELTALGLDVELVTGDGRATADAVARELGIAIVHAAQLPEDKAARIRALQAQGRKVAFVGDGINDAPALAQADVGVAIGTGTDIAIETGDLVLMRGDLGAFVDGVRLGRRVLGIIRQNFVWAYAYNVLLIPIAAGALIPRFGIALSPILAAAAMSVSSLFVFANSARLSLGRPKESPAQGESVDRARELVSRG